MSHLCAQQLSEAAQPQDPVPLISLQPWPHQLPLRAVSASFPGVWAICNQQVCRVAAPDHASLGVSCQMRGLYRVTSWLRAALCCYMPKCGQRFSHNATRAGASRSRSCYTAFNSDRWNRQEQVDASMLLPADCSSMAMQAVGRHFVDSMILVA